MKLDRVFAVITMLAFAPAVVAQNVVLITQPFEFVPTEVALVTCQITNQTSGERRVAIEAVDRAGAVLAEASGIVPAGETRGLTVATTRDLRSCRFVAEGDQPGDYKASASPVPSGAGTIWVLPPRKN